MTHRHELFDVTLRWMNDDFHPGDGEKITRIFVYESAVSAIVIERITRFLEGLFNGPLHMQRIRHKHSLRQRIIDSVSVSNARIQELAESFHRNPKYYFPYLPIDAAVITDNDSRLVAIGRIKRLSRIAEKVSFRLVDALFREIQAEAAGLAGRRAEAAGVPLSDFISSPRNMHDDFVSAEENIASMFRDKQVRIEPEALTVNDIVGFKIIARQKVIDEIPGLLSLERGLSVVETEQHEGDYNAVNILLDINLPPAEYLVTRLKGVDWEIARQRGLDPDGIREHVTSYVNQGERTVRAELILTTPEELMEAEFGRSIHELRVLRLRHRQEYCGPLGQNAGYLIEYMLALAASPAVFIPEIPIKMYGRYLPEEIAALKSTLHGKDIEEGLLGAFSLQK